MYETRTYTSDFFKLATHLKEFCFCGVVVVLLSVVVVVVVTDVVVVVVVAVVVVAAVANDVDLGACVGRKEEAEEEEEMEVAEVGAEMKSTY